jgi:uncharacterized protein (TIGR03437 family)
MQMRLTGESAPARIAAEWGLITRHRRQIAVRSGFGPTDPSVPAGKPFTGAAPTTNQVQVMINNIPVAPAFSGITSAGLYQLNLVNIPAGLGFADVSVRAIAGGLQTPAGAVISLQ